MAALAPTTNLTTPNIHPTTQIDRLLLLSSASRAVMEATLAHVIPDATEAAYARSDLTEKRRALMTDWAAYVA